MRNDVFELKGTFEQRTRDSRPGRVTLPKGAEITSEKLEKLTHQLIELKKFWIDEKYVNGALINIQYRQLVAKSNRVVRLFSFSKPTANDSIVGVKFTESESNPKHIITYHLQISDLERTIEEIRRATQLLNTEFKRIINDEFFDDDNEKYQKWNLINFGKYSLAKTNFQQIIRDVYFVERFDKPESNYDTRNRAIINFYETSTPIVEILERLDIHVYGDRKIDETTVLLDEDHVRLVMDEIPYLVAMSVEDLSELSPTDFQSSNQLGLRTIPNPTVEPTIGVIDTLFDTTVYFSEWVEYHNMIDDRFVGKFNSNDARHGTAVSSIIVDGPSLNPNLDDGCGRFRVRHFGVATAGGFSSFTIAKKIREIVLKNSDIKVWNLSLGSVSEVNRNFISTVAAVLDEIQFEHDVIFIVAGTNNNENEPKKIGSPADSINSLVVNSVAFDKTPANYTREGIVLSFFVKPDVSYYGGCGIKKDYINVREPNEESRVAGTSYAAPWIARKLAYLIHYMNISREVAKALIIDSTIGWDGDYANHKKLSVIGHGIVPRRIEDVLQSQIDEIKFVVSGVSKKWDSYSHRFPIPEVDGSHPFRARATMCYFPKSSRNQGVDYTNTELNIKFGRIDDKGNVIDIKKNKQDEGGILFEEEARTQFRKWDNVKHISEGFNERAREKKAYQRRMWGMRITTTERLRSRDGVGIRFGVVVTLQELNGVNRIQDFIHRCSLNGWLVNRISVDNRLDVYNVANEEIQWDE